MANTITYDDGAKGWTSFHSWIPDWMSRLNNRFFTVKDGQLYLHNDEDNPVRNNFYGVQYPTTLTYMINVEPSSIKVAKTINTESNKAFDVEIKSYLNDETSSITQSTIDVSEFLNKEGKWYAYTRRNELDGDYSAKSAYGIGRVQAILGTNLQLRKPIVSPLISAGDDVFINTTSAPVGKIVSYSGINITLDTAVGGFIPDQFVWGVKNGRIEGSEIRGYNFEVTLTDDTTDRTELYAVSSELFKSEPS
jgi:hypothetical protein